MGVFFWLGKQRNEESLSLMSSFLSLHTLNHGSAWTQSVFIREMHFPSESRHLKLWFYGANRITDCAYAHYQGKDYSEPEGTQLTMFKKQRRLLHKKMACQSFYKHWQNHLITSRNNQNKFSQVAFFYQQNVICHGFTVIWPRNIGYLVTSDRGGEGKLFCLILYCLKGLVTSSLLSNHCDVS